MMFLRIPAGDRCNFYGFLQEIDDVSADSC